MSIEQNLERIAVALEKLASAEPVTVATLVDPVAVVAPVAQAPRPRGRPPGSTKAAPAETAPVEQESDPFQVAEAPAVTATKEQVRAALVAYQARSTPDKARAVLKSVGGVDTLPMLPEAKYAAVIAAANSAK